MILSHKLFKYETEGLFVGPLFDTRRGLPTNEITMHQLRVILSVNLSLSAEAVVEAHIAFQRAAAVHPNGANYMSFPCDLLCAAVVRHYVANRLKYHGWDNVHDLAAWFDPRTWYLST